MTHIDFGGRLVGDSCATYVVAELGYSWCISTSHQRNLDELESLVTMAASAGADCVKLQIRSLGPDGFYATKGENLDVAINDPASPWKTRREFVELREPTDEVLCHLDALCSSAGIQWTASAWDLPSVELLAGHDPSWIKVASASLTDREVLRAVAATGKPLVVSTGMAALQDVVTASGHMFGDLTPWDPEFHQRVILSHTTSSYPCPDDDVNLKAIKSLHDFGCLAGYSGHEDGIALTFAAVVMGACWVERHVTMNRSAWHKDHRASLEPDGLRRLVRDIRRFERAVGDGVKRLMPSEQPFLSLRRVS